MNVNGPEIDIFERIHEFWYFCDLCPGAHDEVDVPLRVGPGRALEGAESPTGN